MYWEKRGEYGRALLAGRAEGWEGEKKGGKSQNEGLLLPLIFFELVPLQNVKSWGLPNGNNYKQMPKEVCSRTVVKERPRNIDDFCRLCDCSLKNKYGTLNSFVNLHESR